MSAVRLVSWPKVVIYGDSLTQYGFSHDGGWVSKVADLLQRKCDVINRGFSGYNSRWNRLMLPRLITEKDAADIVAFVIFLGPNDSNLPEGIQHVPVMEYKKNLIAMADYLKSLGIEKEKLIIIGPPPCVDEAWAEYMKSKDPPKASTQSNTYKEQYVNACKNAAVESGAQFVDLYFTMMKENNWQKFLSDGLHFSSEGAEFVFSELKPVIEQVTRDLTELMPLWDEVDPQNPEKSLL